MCGNVLEGGSINALLKSCAINRDKKRAKEEEKEGRKIFGRTLLARTAIWRKSVEGGPAGSGIL